MSGEIFDPNNIPAFTHFGDEEDRLAHDNAYWQGLKFGVAFGITEQEEVILNAVTGIRYLLRERDNLLHKDPITGLPDYRGVEESYKDLVQTKARRFGEQRESSLLYVDVDKLSELNNHLTHAGADELLRGIAAVFQTSTRAGDIVGRHAGDQFIIILPGAPILKGLEKAEEIRQKVYALEYSSIHPSITVGVDTVDSNKELDELFMAASRAVLDSKNKNERNCVIAVARLSLT